jgi:hypothetical protein
VLTSYWLTPAEILVSENNHSGFYHGELRMLTLLEHSADDLECGKLDKLFYFYLVKAQDPILMVYSTDLAGAFIEQGYNRFYAGIVRGEPYWQSARIISNIPLEFNVSSDLKIHYNRSVEIFDRHTAEQLLTTGKIYKKWETVLNAGEVLNTRRADFDFAVESKKVLDRAKPGRLIAGHRVHRLSGTRPGDTVVVDVKDHGSVVTAIRTLFKLCTET